VSILRIEGVLRNMRNMRNMSNMRKIRNENILTVTPVQTPLVYVIPVESILGKLSVVQAGDTGTIPMETRAGSQAEIEALRDKYYPGAYADTLPGKGDGCRLWHTNPWALGWSRDM